MVRDKNSLPDKVQFRQLLFIAMGAVPGALIRWQVNNDLAVNVLGSAVLGILLGLSCRPRLQLFLGVGFCGSLTTFSGWIYACIHLFAIGLWLKGFLLIVSCLILGLFAVAFGFWLGKKIKHLRPFQ